ncbi:MAG TPA: TOBE domain-containing protein, partial [Burkholderiaceae bacterium]|nr:TOBE domain-containing protein [Burkholderiaceae bacterium]
MTTKPGRSRRLIGTIAFETPAGAVFGDTRIRLLEAIAEHGSLNRAAKAVPLSYKAAWDALAAMNNLAEAPLVVRTTGGRNGGGTQLTEHGRRMVALYRAMERSQQDILDQVSAPRTLAAVPAEGAALRTLLRRMAVKTSARNQFVGSVVEIVDVGGMADVRLRLDGADEIVATITPESVETMALRPGVQAHALIKAPWVSVAAKAPRRDRARNVFDGTIAELAAGPVSTRLTVTTAGGRAIAAAMPRS